MKRANNVWTLLGQLSWLSRAPVRVSGLSAPPTTVLEPLLNGTERSRPAVLLLQELQYPGINQECPCSSLKQGKSTRTSSWFPLQDSNKSWMISLPTTTDELSFLDSQDMYSCPFMKSLSVLSYLYYVCSYIRPISFITDILWDLKKAPHLCTIL